EIKTSLREFLSANDYIHGRNVTSFLQKFELHFRPLNMDDTEKKKTFVLATHPEVEWRLSELGAECVDFNLNDKDRMTVSKFTDWILSSKKFSDPQEILRDFEKYEELNPRSRIMFVDKPRAYLEVLPLQWKDVMYERLCARGRLSETWAEVQEVARQEGGVAREKAAGAQFLREAASTATPMVRAQTAPGDNGATQDQIRLLTEQMNQLQIFQTALGNDVQSIRQLMTNGTPIPRPAGVHVSVKACVHVSVKACFHADMHTCFHADTDEWAHLWWGGTWADVCLWCDELGHGKRFCRDLGEAIRQGVVVIKDGRISRPEGTILVPQPAGAGGMKALIRGGLKRQGATGPNREPLGPRPLKLVIDRSPSPIKLKPTQMTAFHQDPEAVAVDAVLGAKVVLDVKSFMGLCTPAVIRAVIYHPEANTAPEATAPGPTQPRGTH
ncbi:MAG: hypothetical protein BJ554DRAFT_5937, partial [Olpidium bornovanus]